MRKQFKKLEESSINEIVKNEIIAYSQVKNNVGVIYIEDNLIKMCSIVSESLEVYYTKESFTDLNQVMNYLRECRYDSALDFDIYKVSEGLISALYKNRSVDIIDIL